MRKITFFFALATAATLAGCQKPATDNGTTTEPVANEVQATGNATEAEANSAANAATDSTNNTGNGGNGSTGGVDPRPK